MALLRAEETKLYSEFPKVSPHLLPEDEWALLQETIEVMKRHRVCRDVEVFAVPFLEDLAANSEDRRGWWNQQLRLYLTATQVQTLSFHAQKALELSRQQGKK